MMKNRLAAGVLCVAMAFGLAACGSQKRSGQMDIDPEKQVKTLCEYDGIEVELPENYEVTDEKVNETLAALLNNFGIGTVEVTDRTTVEDGDYVNVDYTGYWNGEAFSGGSATGATLQISDNNGYIPGFTDDLVGAEVGSTVSSDITFPDEYPNNPDLAGQLTTFEFVINGIYEPVTMDTLTDELVEENFAATYGYSTKQELLDYIRDYLEQASSVTQYNDTVAAAKQYMLDNCEVEIPEEYLDARVREYQESFISDYCDETEELEDYLQDNYQMSVEEAVEEWTTFEEEQIKIELIFGLIAQREGIELEEEEYANYVSSFVNSENFDFEDETAVYEYFGAGSAEEGEAYLRKLYLANKAIDFVADHALVTVTIVD